MHLCNSKMHSITLGSHDWNDPNPFCVDPDLHGTTFRGNPGRENTLEGINILDSSRQLCPLQTGLNRTLDSLIAGPVLVSRLHGTSIQATVSVTLWTSSRSGHLTTRVEMRKQCPLVYQIKAFLHSIAEVY